MRSTLPHNHSRPEGPILHWKEEDTLQFTYLTMDSTEHFLLSVEPAEQQLEVPGQLHDHDVIYQVQRNPQTPAAEQQGIEKILILGDMHGMYGKLFKFLHHNKVIDADGHWSWGRGHLVMSGDVLDRGDAVTETLWLLYHLEQEAAQAGGAVHYLLGNHELMVMEGDLRYVNRYYHQLFREQKIPYQDQFNRDAVFGQWLRSRNTVICLNELLISHAGISPLVAREGLSIADINSNMKRYLQQDHADHLTELLAGQQGPLWYRGYIMAGYGFTSPGQEGVEQILEQYQASHMAVAHTTVDHVQSRFHGKVFAVDMEVNDPGVSLEGLLVEQGKFFRLKEDASLVEL